MIGIAWRQQPLDAGRCEACGATGNLWLRAVFGDGQLCCWPCYVEREGPAK